MRILASSNQLGPELFLLEAISNAPNSYLGVMTQILPKVALPWISIPRQRRKKFILVTGRVSTKDVEDIDKHISAFQRALVIISWRKKSTGLTFLQKVFTA